MSFSAYIHIPFCTKKCPYCGFSSVTGVNNHFIDEYFDSLISELQLCSNGIFSGSPRTICIGGGTPSVISPNLYKRLIDQFNLDKTSEISIEANPESVNTLWLNEMLELGVNRLSIGIQSTNDRILHNLGRIHNKKEAIGSFELARQAGFNNISVDLMFGVPGQTMEIWSRTVEDITEIEPEHISCYSLGIEEDTEYYAKSESGNLKIPDDDETADMYLLMTEKLENSGYEMYEISNFAKKGYECRHNKAYWDFTPYLGLGASAHSFDGTKRSWNEYEPETYVGKIKRGESAVSGHEMSEGDTRIIETIMLSLRTCDGLHYESLKPLDPEKKTLLESKIDLLINSGHMKPIKSGNIIFTPKGAVIANEIISDIIADMF